MFRAKPAELERSEADYPYNKYNITQAMLWAKYTTAITVTGC